MRFLLPVLFLSMLLAACIGHRSVPASPGSISLDCDMLARKQRQQYRMAMRESRTSERRKSLSPKFRDKNITERMGTAKTEQMLAVPYQNETSTLIEYSSSLVSKVAEPVPTIIRKALSNHEEWVANTYPNVPQNRGPEKVSAFTKFENDAMIWPALLIGGVLGILSINMFHAQARAMARWSKENKLKARSTLVVLKTATVIGYTLLGAELYNSGYAIPEFVRITSLGALGVALAFYPSRYFPSGAPAFGFIERKVYDASIFTAGAIIMLYAGNRYDVNLQTLHAAPSTTVAHITVPRGIAPQSQEVSIVKREFKQQLKTFAKDPPKAITKGEKIVLTVLLILLGIAVTFGVAALACTIACNGSEIAGFVIGAGGAGVIAWGLTAAIRSVHRRPTKKRAKQVESVTRHPSE